MSNEKEIRTAFKNMARSSYEEIIVIDEFCGGTMQTRSDLALINQESFAMVEIKSDKDSLSRLENQVKDYNKYSTNIFIVLDIIHKKAFEKYADKISRIHYELFYYDDGVFISRSKEIQKLDKYHMRPWATRKINMYELLWRDEKKQFISFIKGRSKVDLNDAIDHIYTYAEICVITHSIIFDRVKRNEGRDKRHIPNHGVFNDFKHKEYKQILFNEFINQH